MYLIVALKIQNWLSTIVASIWSECAGMIRDAIATPGHRVMGV